MPLPKRYAFAALSINSDHLPLNSPLTNEGHHRSLPHRLRLLCVGPQEPPWPLLALRLDAAGCAEAKSEWNSTASEALATLRRESFDVIVIQEESVAAATKSAAISLVEAIRAGGTLDPVAVILAQPDDDRFLQFEEFDCEVLISPHGWQSRALIAAIRRAVTRGNMRHDFCALESAARRGRSRERDEAQAQLRELRALVAGRQSPEPEASHVAGRTSGDWRSGVPTQIERYYRELLKTYVMMGSGNIAQELEKLAEILSLSGTSMHETLSLHLRQVESLMEGLGNRSSRHIMTRADLLALELMLRLGECYRTRSRFRGLGDEGVDLLHARILLDKEEE